MGCSGTTVTQVVNVRGNLGCSYTITRPISGNFNIYSVGGLPGGTTCYPPAGGGVTYTWTAAGNTAQVTTSNGVYFPTALTSGAVVTVVIQDDSQCLLASATQSVLRPAGGGGSTGTPTPATAESAGPYTLGVQLSAYPNPVASELHVDLLRLKGTARLLLSDNLGRLVRQRTTERESATLDVRGLPAGLYSVRVELPDGNRLTQKVEVRP